MLIVRDEWTVISRMRKEDKEGKKKRLRDNGAVRWQKRRNKERGRESTRP